MVCRQNIDNFQATGLKFLNITIESIFKSDHLVLEENYYSCARLVPVQRNE